MSGLRRYCQRLGGASSQPRADLPQTSSESKVRALPHHVRTKLILREWPRLLALAALVALLWFFIYGRFSAHSIGTPIIYAGGDELWVHAVVKAMADGEIGLFGAKNVSRLGAPFGANWNDFPLTEDFIFYLTGLLAKALWCRRGD